LKLTAAGSGIADAAGNLLAADATDSWLTDTTSGGANPDDPYDVNDDGTANQLDILALINVLTILGGPTSIEGYVGPPYYDVDNDQLISILDILALVNHLSLESQPVSMGETEGTDVLFNELSASEANCNDEALLILLAEDSAASRKKRHGMVQGIAVGEQ
jgi:hypothetical protein